MPPQAATNSPSSKLLLLLSLAALVINYGYASAPETVVQALKRYGIEVNEAALIQALSDPRKEVRGLSAAELAEMKVTKALPEIVRAAESETDGLTQVNIAAAATWLGSEQGLSLLKGICAERTKPGYVRVAAARNVFKVQDHICFLSLVDMIDRGTDTEGRIEGLGLLAQVSPKADYKEKEALRLALKALQDPEVIVRLQACEAIKWIGDPRAIPPLQEALGHEQEEVVRDRIAAVLKFLRGNARQLHE
ncbi:MAG: HEAT repeat domain-containing protein [Candidatus Korobacteraceae bacterium]|jgi:HEAT repeat protein